MLNTEKKFTGTYNNMKIKAKNAFTLTEILIALAVIGVIAGTTIPVFITNTNNHAYVAGLKRGYLALKTATSEIIMENAGTAESLAGNGTIHPDMDDLMEKYCTKLSCMRKCNVGAPSQDCWAIPGKSLDGNTTWNWNTNFQNSTISSAVLSNGMTVAFYFLPNVAPKCNDAGVLKSDGGGYGCATILLDVNGFKKPNIHGRDIYTFYLHKEGFIPAGTKGKRITTMQADYNIYCNPSNVSVSSGAGCAGRVLTENKMNY